MVRRRELHDGWTVGGAGVRVPAIVPGVVHLDLLAAGLIPDPYLDLNERDVEWVARTYWTYETRFEWAPDVDQHVELVAEGLDTVAHVSLNGVPLGSVRTMHRTHRFDVTGVLRAGSNDLVVAFRAPLDAALEAAAELGDRPRVNPHPYNALRKNASSYGWDWGPDLPSAGIWRPLYLQSWTTARLRDVRPLVDVRPDGTGVVTVHTSGSEQLAVRATVAGVSATAVDGPVRVEVPDADLWWPAGYGPQPLYELVVELLDGDVVLDRSTTRIGFRTVSLDTEPDEHGTSFRLRVNGTPVLVRGVNWIPDDAFLPRVDAARYARRLRQALDLGANLVRVWGGGIHESEDFYRVCDELGLLVWQDLLFACAAYAEEEPLASEVHAEVAEAVTRLAPHPSLVLWCGGNECLWGHEDWGWPAQLGDLSWGAGYWLEALPSLVGELDPTRPYIPGSPYSPPPGVHPNDPSHGPTHIWDVWNQRDWTGYLSYRPRFVSEFGFQAPPTFATLRRALHDDPLTPDSPGMLAHQKAEDGNGKLARGLRGHLPDPETFEDWHWATQLNQARALTAGIEHFRALAPVCTGAIVWQLNDCWPVTSWSLVDGDGRLKPAWYAVRRAFRSRLAVVRPADAGLELALLADSADPWAGTARVTRVAFDGTVLARAELPFRLVARESTSLPLPDDVTQPADPAAELLVVTLDGADRTYHWFTEDVAGALPPPSFEVTTTKALDGHDVTITARTLLKDVALLADRLDPDATVDDMLLTLLPGESVTLHVHTTADLPPDALSRPALRCANDLLIAPAGAP